MSRIDELIAQLCPDGVEFLEIRQVTDRPTNIKWSEVTGEGFRYIDLTSVDRFTRSIAETQIITRENAPSRAQQIVKEGDVIFGTTRPLLKRYTLISQEFDNQICSTGYCVLRPNKERVLPNFIFHLLGTESFYKHVEANEKGASYPSISDSAVKDFKIPVPPIEIQREIVKVLDTFTQLEAELEAELEARRRQYTYYRDALLNFVEHSSDSSKQASKQAKIRWMTLGEVANIVRGASPRPISSFLTKSQDGIPWIKIGDVPINGKYITLTAEKITSEGARNSRLVKPGDFVLSNSMSFGRPYISKIEGCIHDGWLAISEFTTTFIADFLYHLLRSASVQNEFERRAGAGTVRNLNADIVKAVRVPVPPLEEQQRIVEILDKFDALVNDISTGLPAEIKARRQQYEHYRDRLLTFKEAA